MGTSYLCNRFLFELVKGNVDVDTDSFKACLMASGYSFNRAHNVWADVSGSELATGNGYTQDTKTLTAAPTVTESGATEYRVSIVWADVSWTTSGVVGPTPGMIIYDDTHGDDIIVGYIDFGGEQTLPVTGLVGIIKDPTMYITTPASASADSFITDRFVYELVKGNVDLDTDSLKACLMAADFAFNRDTMNVWGDVSGSEIAAGNGYTQDTAVLANIAITEDDTNHWAKMAWDAEQWTGSGGSIAATAGMIIYDDTHASDIIVGYISAGGNQIITDGVTAGIINPILYLASVAPS
jgi:hypothetical protein